MGFFDNLPIIGSKAVEARRENAADRRDDKFDRQGQRQDARGGRVADRQDARTAVGGNVLDVASGAAKSLAESLVAEPEPPPPAIDTTTLVVGGVAVLALGAAVVSARRK